MKKIILIIISVSLLLAGNIFAGGQSDDKDATAEKVKPITVFIAGTSGAEDTQSMGHFDYAKRLIKASDGVIEADRLLLLD